MLGVPSRAFAFNTFRFPAATAVSPEIVSVRMVALLGCDVYRLSGAACLPVTGRFWFEVGLFDVPVFDALLRCWLRSRPGHNWKVLWSWTIVVPPVVLWKF